ncbi:peptidoglycan-binding domain-containing protein [Sulfurovum sp.]|uniref:peptidoglycan-binding domain-containing protein n=1 Tax=Sulfurovum sp. TaxID=1969726 RepID=UPI0025D7B7B9|nr:peptidoglycan-binding domain-containing protein [Sulfurovum sp.]
MKINYSNLLVAMLLPLTYVNAEDVSLTPPNAKPGECYARVVLPAKYETVEEKVMVKEPSEEISIVPAEYGTAEEEIEVVPATKKLTVIPAKFKEVPETIEVKPAIRTWKTSLKKKAAPVSPEILAAVKAAGVDVDSAQPGDCYKEYYTPRKFKTVTEDVLIRSEYNETEVIPPEFETVEKTVVVKPASKEVIEVPAVYEETEEQVLVEPEKTVWKKGQNPAQKVSGATGEIMCLVKVPAKYKTIKKRVLKTPATTKVVEVPEETKVIKVKKLISDTQIKQVPMPALYETIEKTVLESNATFSWHNAKDKVESGLKSAGHQICLKEDPAKTKKIKKIVLDTPSRVEEEIIPAENEVVAVQKLITEAKEVKTPIEAEYKMMKKRKKVADTHIEWKRILCQTNMTKDIIAKLQSALNEKGYSAGKPDGVLGRGTRRALDQFQKDSGLATGGITYETLNALGITL